MTASPQPDATPDAGGITLEEIRASVRSITSPPTAPAPQPAPFEPDHSAQAAILIDAQREWGGTLFREESGKPWLLGCEYDGDVGQACIEASGLTFYAHPRAPANDNRAERQDASRFPGIMSSADFVRGFQPPDYIVDGIIQAGFLYSITGQTGSGKTAVALLLASCIARGLPFAGQEVKLGRVLYFAGENPDDVRMRWIGLCHEAGLSPEDIDAHFVEGVFSIGEFAERIAKDVDALGGVSTIFVDTTAAYFPGTDENSNVEMGSYARLLRSLTRMACRPAVIAASHPIKNAAADNLLPRGGGAFLNEVDGNLSLAKRADRTSALHWQGKFRGPEFEPITFDLPEVRTPTLIDSRGREIPTVMARPVDAGELAARSHASDRDDAHMLLAIRANGNRSLRELASDLGWGDDDAAKRKAQSVTDRLKRAQHVTYGLGAWKLTKKGDEAAILVANREHQAAAAAHLAEGVIKGAHRKRTRHRRRGTTDEYQQQNQ